MFEQASIEHAQNIVGFIEGAEDRTEEPAPTPKPVVTWRGGIPRRPNLRLTRTPENRKTHVSSKIEDTDDQQEKTQAAVSMSDEGLKRLREALKTISFYHPGLSFKADRKDDCVWIRAMVSEHGLQSTKHSTKAKLDLLADAATMPADEFGARLELYLKKKGFEL